MVLLFFIPFPVLVCAILGMCTGLSGFHCAVLHYGTDLFAGLWHSCCLGSVLTLFASFLPFFGAIVAWHQLSLLLSPRAGVEPQGHVTHPGILGDQRHAGVQLPLVHFCWHVIICTSWLWHTCAPFGHSIHVCVGCGLLHTCWLSFFGLSIHLVVGCGMTCICWLYMYFPLAITFMELFVVTQHTFVD